jgi:hypothetical protein
MREINSIGLWSCSFGMKEDGHGNKDILMFIKINFIVIADNVISSEEEHLMLDS